MEQTKINPKTWLKTAKERAMPQRVIVYTCGLLLAALGVAIAINSQLGISPISSFPYVLSRVFGIGVGICLIAVFAFFVLLQIIILRRDFKLSSFIQIPALILFGYFVDFFLFVLGDFQIPTYFGRLFMLLVGMVLVATGVTLYVLPGFAALPPEALVAAMAFKSKQPFHRMKILLDCTVVATAIILSLVFLNGFYGAREGTVLSAICIGKMIPYIRKAVLPTLKRMGIDPGQAGQ